MNKVIHLLFLVALLVAGCTSDSTMPQPSGTQEIVHVGMTKAEVLKVLGHKPKSIQTSPRGEVWHYDNVELAMIPFNFGFRPEFKNYIFDDQGVLIDFNTTQPAR